MKQMRWLLGVMILVSCGPRATEIEGVDLDSWRADINGCKSKRVSIAPKLEESWSELEGLTQPQIEATLGKPDHHELYQRSQKFFIYYLTPGPGCNTYDSLATPRKIHIRFNALGFANELAYREY